MSPLQCYPPGAQIIDIRSLPRSRFTLDPKAPCLPISTGKTPGICWKLTIYAHFEDRYHESTHWCTLTTRCWALTWCFQISMPCNPQINPTKSHIKNQHAGTGRMQSKPQVTLLGTGRPKMSSTNDIDEKHSHLFCPIHVDSQWPFPQTMTKMEAPLPSYVGVPDGRQQCVEFWLHPWADTQS